MLWNKFGPKHLFAFLLFKYLIGKLSMGAEIRHFSSRLACQLTWPVILCAPLGPGTKCLSPGAVKQS